MLIDVRSALACRYFSSSLFLPAKPVAPVELIRVTHHVECIRYVPGSVMLKCHCIHSINELPQRSHWVVTMSPTDSFAALSISVSTIMKNVSPREIRRVPTRRHLKTLDSYLMY